MSSRLLLPSLLLFAVLATPLEAGRQNQVPDLAGTWTLADSGDRSGGVAPFYRSTVITQDSDGLTVVTGQDHVSYRLDGQETTRKVPTVAGGQWTLRSRVAVSASSLDISTTYQTDIGVWTDTVACSLQDRDHLVVVAKVNVIDQEQPVLKRFVYVRQIAR
jgi:hypothetical protein